MRSFTVFRRAAACGPLALALLPAGPLHAQTPGACGQPAAASQAVAAPLVEGFEPIRSFVEIRRSEPRYVEFTLAAPQAVTLRTEAPETDPVITLYDERGGLVTWDDDSGGNLQALVAQDLAAGRYCAQVRPSGAAPVDFAVTVLVLESGLRTAPGMGTPCADPALVRDLALSLSSPVSPVALDATTDAGTGFGDFRLSLSEPLGLRIDAASPEFDTYLTILDASGNVVAQNDDFTGLDSRVEHAFAPGDYCVSVSGVGGTGGGFSIALSEADIAPPPMPCEDPARVTPLASGFGPGAPAAATSGVLDPETGLSWFGLSVAEGTEIRLDTRSAEFDTMIDLHDMAGGFVAANDDGPDGSTDSRIDTTLVPGDYCVTVRSFDGTPGAFDLTLAAAGAGAAPAPLDPAAAASVEDMGVLETEVRSYTISGDPTLWAAFVVTEPGPVTVEGVSVSSAFSVTLFAEDGTELGAAGPVEPMSAGTIRVDLAPGTYRVALSNDGASGTILRQITVRRD